MANNRNIVAPMYKTLNHPPSHWSIKRYFLARIITTGHARQIKVTFVYYLCAVVRVGKSKVFD